MSDIWKVTKTLEDSGFGAYSADCDEVAEEIIDETENFKGDSEEKIDLVVDILWRNTKINNSIELWTIAEEVALVLRT